MRGHLRQRRKGTWPLIVPLGRDPLTGRKRYRSRTVHGTKREAERALRELCGHVDEGRLTGAETTVGDLLAAWLDQSADELSPTTMREYRRLVAKRIEPALGSVPLIKLTTPQLDEFYLALGRDAGLSPSSVRQVHSILRRAFRQAVRWGWILHNPAVNASPPRVRRKEIVPPTLDELRALMTAAEAYDPSFGVFVRLAAATGMRRGELCGLRWCDIDLDRAVIRVCRSVVAVPDGTIEKETKTRATRRIALDEATAETLHNHAARVGIDGWCGPALVESDCWTLMLLSEGSMGRWGYPPEFRRTSSCRPQWVRRELACTRASLGSVTVAGTATHSPKRLTSPVDPS